VHLNLSSISYWHSSEAKKLFHPKGELSALDAVNNPIELLLRAMDCGGRTTEEIIEDISDHQRWMV
jgi:hypothetical protein